MKYSFDSSFRVTGVTGMRAKKLNSVTRVTQRTIICQNMIGEALKSNRLRLKNPCNSCNPCRKIRGGREKTRGCVTWAHPLLTDCYREVLSTPC